MQESEPTLPLPTTVAGGRYLVEQQIGQGGMAVVYQAVDTASGRRVALKQLRPRDESDSSLRTRELFEREFHTLAQLAHPRIVAVIDYGIDGELPYYTMELLDGGDLLSRGPLPWQQACAVARDICSALSLVHSRRMVYRDLSPRNVRCTSDGMSKLIDFGAMAPMGSAQLAVCTPAVAPPEVVYRQPLDARSDLYALGATLYCTLVGRSPYPARNLQQLVELWTQAPPLPSDHRPEIPAALDALVMDLLQLDPQLRPASAAEVSQRLSAIADLPSPEQLLVSQAYLTTPTLVGREHELELLENAAKRMLQRKRGSALWVRGPHGIGRSRFLDACVLAGKLAGLSVVRAAAATSPSDRYGAAQALASQLLELLPDETLHAALPHAAVLAQVLPQLRDKLAAQPTPPASEDLQAQSQPALRSFFLAIAEMKPLLIAIDDVDRMDTDSRALCALLAQKTGKHALLLVASSDSESAIDDDAERMLAEACSELVLAKLDVMQTHVLLASIFGDVPNLELLVRRMHALSAGNPQNLMRLAQHLLDRGIVHYGAGAWVLPERIDEAELPATMAQAFIAAVAALDPEARSLAQALAQGSDQRFRLEECIALTAHGDAAHTFRSLDRLSTAGVIAETSGEYALAGKAWVAALAMDADPEAHARLSRVYLERGDGLRATRHLFCIGRELQGLDVLVEYSIVSRERTSADPNEYVRMLATVPHDWLEICERGIALCETLGRPARDAYQIQLRISGLLSQADLQSKGNQAALAQRLAYDVGLDLYAKLDPTLPQLERIKRALGAAAERHARARPEDQVIEPKAAIAQLARVTITGIGNFSRTLDVAEWRQMPSLMPLIALSPAVAVTERLAAGFEARVCGRFEHAGAVYREMLAQLERDAGSGLDPTFADSIRAGVITILGIMDAGLALASSEQYASAVERFPLYHGSALAIRMLAKLWAGDVAGADRLERERELWRLEQSRRQSSDPLTVLWKLWAHALSDDLTRVRESLVVIERSASKLHTWEPIASWARGEYERIRGDHGAALTALDAALSRMQAGQHQIWPLAAAARIKVLYNLGRFDDARVDGERYLADASASQLGYVASYIRMPLACALAKLGSQEQAREQAQAAIATFEQLNSTGLSLGLAYEAAAMVAELLGDTEALERYAAQCKRCFVKHRNPALGAKYQRLVRVQRRKPQAAQSTQWTESPESVLARTQIESMLQGCDTRQTRLDAVVSLLLSTSGATGGVLYGVTEGEPALCARVGIDEVPTDIAQLARRCLAQQLEGGDADTTAQESDAISSTQWTGLAGRSYRPIVLNHQCDSGFLVNGLVVLAFDGVPPLQTSAELAMHVSRAIADSGDLLPRRVHA